MSGLPPVIAPLESAAGGLLLALLPARAFVAFRVLAPVFGVLTLALTLASTRPTAGFGADDVGSGFGCVAALLGATLSVAYAGDPWFGGLGSGPVGRRLRLARALPQLMVAASLFAVGSIDPALAISALAALALLSSLAAGSARGSAAALASWRLLRLQSIAVAGCLLGLFLLRARAVPVGAGMMLLGFAAVGGMAPFGGVLAEVVALANAPFASLVVGLLPLTALALLLRIRLVLIASGLRLVVDDALLLSGLLSIATGAALVWMSADGTRRDAAACAGVFGLAVFAFGLGDAAGLQAGLVALLAASFALPANVLARRSAGGWLRAGTSLAAGCVPPFGLFAAGVLVIEDTLARAPALLVPLLVLACLLLAGSVRAGSVLADRPTPTRAVQVVLALHLTIAIVIGLALPGAISDRIVDMAERLAGATG